MIELKQKSDCCGCSACVERCPKSCIRMQEDNEGFLYPVVNEAACIKCGLCEKVCPVIHQICIREPQAVYAAKNPDEQIRLKSSSGGIFTALAERTIQRGGVVFGARFDEKWEVAHDFTETIEGLALFRSSKYVQSRIGANYQIAEAFLKAGREVLFSGTPCQIAGLKSFLQKEYAGLLAVDVICHGVPSPRVWREYLKEIVLRPKGATSGKNTVLSSLNEMPVITGISFRDKRLGWKKFGFEIRKSAFKADKNSVLKSGINQEKTFLFEHLHENTFMRGFLADLFLRPSCYDCPAKAGRSGADITLGDYWGIGLTHPELDDDKGVSVIIINSLNGAEVLNTLDLELHMASYEDVCSKNPALIHSVRIPTKREQFFAHSSESTIAKIKRLTRPTIKQYIQKCIVRVAKFVLRKNK